MATANYNEVTHSNVSGDINSLDPMFHWDTRFPERLSKLHLNSEYEPPVTRRARRSRARNAARYKTQPITFDEIKEVDEEPTTEEADILGLKNQFAAFSRSMDGLLPGYPAGQAGGKQKATGPPSPSAKTGETSSGISSDSAVVTEHAIAGATSTNQESLRKESLRRRRKKRQQRSIEEVPETDKTDDAALSVG